MLSVFVIAVLFMCSPSSAWCFISGQLSCCVISICGNNSSFCHVLHYAMLSVFVITIHYHPCVGQCSPYSVTRGHKLCCVISIYGNNSFCACVLHLVMLPLCVIAVHYCPCVSQCYPCCVTRGQLSCYQHLW